MKGCDAEQKASDWQIKTTESICSSVRAYYGLSCLLGQIIK